MGCLSEERRSKRMRIIIFLSVQFFVFLTKYHNYKIKKDEIVGNSNINGALRKRAEF
jgi:hypothetical protein